MQHQTSVALLTRPLLADTGSRPLGQAPFIRPLDSMHCSMLPQASAPPLSAFTFSSSSTCLPPTSEYQPHSCLLSILRHPSLIPTHSQPSSSTTQTHSLDSEMERDNTINPQPKYEYEYAYISFLFLFFSPPTPRFYSKPHCPPSIWQDADTASTAHLVPGPGPPRSCTLPLAVGHLFS